MIFKAILHPYDCCQIPKALANFLISRFFFGYVPSSLYTMYDYVSIVPIVNSGLKTSNKMSMHSCEESNDALAKKKQKTT